MRECFLMVGLAVWLPSGVTFTAPSSAKGGRRGRSLLFGFGRQEARSLSDEELARLNPSTLAYVGDAAFELYMRTQHAWPPKALGMQQEKVVHAIRAETQAKIHDIFLVDAELLSEDERRLMKSGRNACKSRGPLRLPTAVYQSATGVECLIGYLYLQNATRCEEVLAFVADAIETDPRVR